ncbi:nuclear transport factor 2 family protein [Alteromonas flava]|uniref:nuclear transport factor 2 family protein n=1 Tax=Alteromonas flava TaxID=2048003 RepID=UPI000C2923C6|nr:nuclear transport factor 2 family protein [Alteromonas flava]
MIKYKLPYLMVFSLIAFNTFSKSNETQIEHEVLAAFDQLVTASKNLDAKHYFKLIDTEKFVGLDSDGTNWNSIEDLKPLITIGFSAIKTISSLEFTNIKVSVIDSQTAILVNEFTQSFTLQNDQSMTISGGGAQVWHKKNGSWKIVSISAGIKH